ncbi:peptidoglycan-binding protein [Streptomyces sp. WP-1]|uniref:peptidoglycan-binding protein n=1 Tax=Streptomyces sp. WP-1 TaxID=3041497 RepID=UPI002649D368|nr:peptidoglycan-binding protein [Streptomyces sp. WP-1]WKE71516.1 peptidoglycan-binding protein [Streptomyces sp. WP-1]
MTAPAFEEFEPARDCGCPGCVHRRRSRPRQPPSRLAQLPARRGMVVVAAVSAALGVVTPVAALPAGHPSHRQAVPGDGPDTPQGTEAPLHGPDSGAARPGGVLTPRTTRDAIIKRAKSWVTAQVPYSMGRYWTDGYRQDCSGYVSMAWGLNSNQWTGSLAKYGVKIKKSQLQPGDMLLFHNTANPQNGSHVVIFGGWTDSAHTHYKVYEQTPPHTRSQTTPYPYWSHAGKYVPYRYKGLATGSAGAEATDGRTSPDYPGADSFGLGAVNEYVTELGRMLIARGAGPYYPNGPGPAWSEADRRATEAFQRAQGWDGEEADGLPGPRTWELLTSGRGRDITPDTAEPASHGVPGYPGKGYFRPGQSNGYVTRLGVQLTRKGFGRFYGDGPGPRWGEADRQAVAAFQRGQGWRGGAADGSVGPETWRRLFS